LFRSESNALWAFHTTCDARSLKPTFVDICLKLTF
jgi:hypothetical protein